MTIGRSETAQAERSLERLFRLTMGRKVHSRQSAAVGAQVTRAGYAVLRGLDDAGGMLSMGELARRCSMDPAVAARQVRALEASGLVERTSREGDGRVSVARVTEDGRRVYRRIVEVRTAYLGKVLADWPSTDRAELTRLVDKLVDGLTVVPFRTEVAK